MKKALLSIKDQVLHKLVLYEVREKSNFLDKFISFDQLQKMYNQMVVVDGNHIHLKNITDMFEYKRLSFYYESIIHEYCKKFRVSEDMLKVTLLEHSNSLNELKTALGYYEYADLYKSGKEEDKEEVEDTNVSYDEVPVEEVGYRSSL
jgi:hypothetical protein